MARRALRREDRSGFTLAEILVGSLVAAVAMGGTMFAFATAARISRAQDALGSHEAGFYAHQSIEQLRNTVGAEPLASNRLWMDYILSVAVAREAWLDMSLPAPDINMENSILHRQAQRKYRVSRVPDCNQDGIQDPTMLGAKPVCHRLEVRVCWDGATAGNCP